MRRWPRWSGFDAVLVAHGVLPDQAAVRAFGRGGAAVVRHERALGARLLLTAGRTRFEAQGQRLPRRHLLARGRPRPAEQLCLWRREGGGHGTCSGPAASTRGQRRSRPDHPARLRRYADDSRLPQRPAVGHARAVAIDIERGAGARFRHRLHAVVLALDHAAGAAAPGAAVHPNAAVGHGTLNFAREISCSDAPRWPRPPPLARVGWRSPGAPARPAAGAARRRQPPGAAWPRRRRGCGSAQRSPRA